IDVARNHLFALGRKPRHADVSVEQEIEDFGLLALLEDCRFLHVAGRPGLRKQPVQLGIGNPLEQGQTGDQGSVEWRHSRASLRTMLHLAFLAAVPGGANRPPAVYAGAESRTPPRIVKLKGREARKYPGIFVPGRKQENEGG